MKSSQKIWAFIPKKKVRAAAPKVRAAAPKVRAAVPTVYAKINAISNTWDYTVNIIKLSF